jgi:hypothetical protein
MVRNLTETDKPGTYSNLLFRVSDYLKGSNKENAAQKMHGINPESFSEEDSSNNNDRGFVKVILNHLFSESKSAKNVLININ